MAPKRGELTEALTQLKDAAAGLTEATKAIRRSNPNGAQQAAPGSSAGTKEKSNREKIIDRVDDAAAALADDDPDEALDILNGLLDDYDEDDAT